MPMCKIVPNERRSAAEFGAFKEGGDCSEALAKAIEASHQSGGGNVVMPTGEYLTGPIRRSPMWEIHPLLCTNVVVRNVNVSSHGPNNDGEASVIWLDATAVQGFSFDTFDIRPTSNLQGADSIATSSFKIELVPEPSTFGLAGLGMLLLAIARRRHS